MSEKKSIEIIVQNKYGIHARPSSSFVKLASKYQSDIFVQKNNVKVNGKSIMGLLAMEATCGSKIIISAEGIDAQQALDALQLLINSKFGFDE